MKYLIKALNTNNRDIKSALMFAIQEKYYLFGCGDGFQRVANCQKLKFGKVKTVFIPSLSSDYFAGFPGFFLSSREASTFENDSDKLIVMGPAGLKQRMEQSTSFCGQWWTNLDVIEVPTSLEDLQVKEDEENKEEMIVDQVSNGASVDAVKTRVANDVFKLQDATDAIAFQDDYVTVYCFKATSGEDDQDVSYSYMGIPIQARPKLLPKKARELGCDPRKHFKLLTAGESVTLDNGTVVTPEQVCEDALPSQAFVFVCLPNESFLESFLKDNSELFTKLALESDKYKTAAVYHSVSMDTLMNPLYRQNFMLQWGKDVLHIFDTPESNKPEYARSKAFSLSHMVKQICPLIIPVSDQDMKDHGAQNREEIWKILESDLGDKNSKENSFSQIGMTYDLYPLKDQKVSFKDVIKMTEQQMIADSKARAEISMVSKNIQKAVFDEKTFNQFQQSMQAPNPFTEVCDEPQVMFLGTSSMKPTQYRGASAIYIVNNKTGLLMDCAEGTYGQLYDHFGKKELVDEAMIKTRFIFITHIHGDHQLGVLKMIEERDKLMAKLPAEQRTKLYIATPTPMMKWMNLFKNESVKHKDLVEFVPSNTLNPEPFYYHQFWDHMAYQDIEQDTSKPLMDKCADQPEEEINKKVAAFIPESENGQEMYKELEKTMDIQKMIAVEVDHCPQSYACMVQSNSFGKIIYSGDTLPCQNFINYGKGAKLVIHEATLQDGLEKDALFKKHTTTSQAIDIGLKCNAWRTVLTHYSPRYAKIAECTDKHLKTKTMIAFDHMRLSLSSFEYAYKMIDIYRKLLSNDD